MRFFRCPGEPRAQGVIREEIAPVELDDTSLDVLAFLPSHLAVADPSIHILLGAGNLFSDMEERYLYQAPPPAGASKLRP